MAIAAAADEVLRELSATHSLVAVGSSIERAGDTIFNTARVYERGELRDFFQVAGLRRLLGQIVGRARWAEDALVARMDEGCDQYVIVGAGLDSFVLRRTDLLERLHRLGIRDGDERSNDA